ncbi:hypothetical protein Cgig2_009149 [Carnegiea gigantea]|uniref:Myb-like domain-containing protein n=1 Tax=Carnegiea gigantea TaxID=171969 RepID=A0A9Q1GP67_9CARY|nr:hypothetical protein Cgig2_009149 [Carnegiea gigantea]
MEMEDQYGISDLRQFISRAAASPAQFAPYAPPPQLPPELSHRHSATTVKHQQLAHYEMLVVSRHVDVLHHHQHQEQFNSDSTTTTATAAATNFDGRDGSCARWPRQETLTLLEVRSRLDHKFKESNQKSPLWDQVARIMSDEHGYHRSGKKCREKFENLYKYYKKTKEGKAGRQDGKHYRFFRQLEALYGSSNPTSTAYNQIPRNNPHFCNDHQPNNSLSLSTSSDDFDASSSDGDDLASIESNGSRKKRKGTCWKAKIQEFIDMHMKKMMEKQETWFEKMMSTMEGREQEMMARQEERRRQEAAWVEREQKFWAWIEARDSTLLKALDTLMSNQWSEPELTRLIQLRTSLESRFHQCGFSEEVLWEDIAAKMACLGYERSAIVCKEKWDSINKQLLLQEKTKDLANNHKGLFMNQVGNEGSSPLSHNSNMNNNVGSVMNDNCLRFFLGDGESLGWEGTNYGMKLNKGENQCA